VLSNGVSGHSSILCFHPLQATTTVTFSSGQYISAQQIAITQEITVHPYQQQLKHADQEHPHSEFSTHPPSTINRWSSGLWHLSSRMRRRSRGLLQCCWFHLGSHSRRHSSCFYHCLQYCVWKLSGCLCCCFARPYSLKVHISSISRTGEGCGED